MRQKKFDKNNPNQRLIIAGMVRLVEEGLTPHEVFALLDEIKQNTFHALSEIQKEATHERETENKAN